MRKFYTLLLLIVCINFPYNDILSQTTNFNDYFPMDIGNSYKFKYNYASGGGGGFEYRYATIKFSRIINSKKYYFLQTLNNKYIPYSNIWIRLDSVTGNIFRYDSTNSCINYKNDILLDSIACSINDTFRTCPSFLPVPYKCNSIGNVIFLGLNTEEKVFSASYSEYGYYYTNEKRFARNFGFVRSVNTSSGHGGSGASGFQLVGCVMNGIVYGDTAVTGINNIKSELPSSFSLHQNYPNPFNPSTKIKFDLPKGSLVKLMIYDVLGREVAVLVNEKLNPGSYEYEWNAINLPGGVYFYKLKSGNFTETRRMVLVK